MEQLRVEAWKRFGFKLVGGRWRKADDGIGRQHTPIVL
jgi:hypothetical protein